MAWLNELRRAMRARTKELGPSIEEEEEALRKAAAEGQLDRVCFLSEERGVDVNAKSTRGCTALMMAAQSGHTDIVRYLAEERGADVNAKALDGATALMLAASRANMDVVRCLTEHDANVNDKDELGRTALMKAAVARREDVVQYLAEEQGSDVEANDFEGVTALMMASKSGYIQVARHLREQGAELNAKDKRGYTALMYAAKSNHIEIVRYLTGCGADVNIKSEDDGLTALLVAAKSGSLEVVRYLVEEGGADLEARSGDGHTLLTMTEFGRTTLTNAAVAGNVQLVRLLVKLGADVNTHDEDGCTALMFAADGGHIDIVRFLADEGGADVNTHDEDGCTALMFAAGEGHIDIVRFLADEGGADVDAIDKDGKTALVHAIQGEHIDAVRCLVQEYGADANVKDKRGDTAVRLAANRGFFEIQRALTPLLPTPLPPRISALSRVSRLFKRLQTQSPDIPANCAIPPSEVDLVSFCKSGNIGGEYRAKWLDADAVVKLFIPEASHSTFEKEVTLWQRLRHPNVIKMYGACSFGPQLSFFVCEYASGGSLLEFIQSSFSEKKPGTWEFHLYLLESIQGSSEKKPGMWKFLLGAALGLEYLHERGIIHGDVRCRNILIGSDGVAKLSNFGLSGSSKGSRLASSGPVCSMRWQSPEVCKGKSPSFASDVYSLGMTILEVVTGIPWRGKREAMAEYDKEKWFPEINDTWAADEPECPPGDARKLVWRMCCHDPKKRVTLSSVVYELQRLASEEKSNHFSPNHESVCTFDDFYEGDLKTLWIQVETEVRNCDNEQHRRAFDLLKRVHERVNVQTSVHPPALLSRFYNLLVEFNRTVQMTPEQARILRLSATRATSNCFHALQWQVQSLLSALGDATDTTEERDERWQKQRRDQVDLFVSGVSNTYLVLQDLKTREERAAFLRTLRAEMDSPVPKYSPEELAVMKKAYRDIKRATKGGDLASLTPEWFIPWYELITDKGECLGSGGFGSVFRAKWLDSDVVVKSLGAADNQAEEDPLLASIAPPLPPAQRAEASQAFRREVDIWFGFSHPHVVQLFGACHVGRPFFVCEFAPNGTLVSYLRANPDQLWVKLYEAALGVQYLHARRVVHGDLKGNNIVVGSDRKAKVTDFELSSIASHETKPQVSAAVHWVAPECLADPTTRPTSVSDVYSLGMCIVEALRVVEDAEAVKAGKASQSCLPWRVGDVTAVKYHATKGSLPARPRTCEDAAWTLVERMCALAPQLRLKISTVVDELARLAKVEEEVPTLSVTTESVDVEAVPRVIAEVQELVSQPPQGSDQEGVELFSLYASLWRRLERVHEQMRDKCSHECRAAFCCLIAEAQTATLEMLKVKASLIALVEIEMRCYALGRRLDKFVDAFGLPGGMELSVKEG